MDEIECKAIRVSRNVSTISKSISNISRSVSRSLLLLRCYVRKIVGERYISRHPAKMEEVDILPDLLVF
jgi:hypothetical protein